MNGKFAWVGGLTNPDGRDAEVESLRAERDALRAQLDRIREARANHPACNVHPDNDTIKCGWKRAVADIDAALDEGGN